MAMDLPSGSFIALSAVAWADGRMSKMEATGLLGAARACGIEGEELAAIERSTKAQVSLDDFDADELSGWQKALTYAIASWLARIDGTTVTVEHESLAALADKLDLGKEKLGAAASAAFDISCLPGGHKPEKYDFVKLVEQLKVKLPSLAG
jgi:hypothetical protein